jgi:hypothetical protein
MAKQILNTGEARVYKYNLQLKRERIVWSRRRNRWEGGDQTNEELQLYVIYIYIYNRWLNETAQSSGMCLCRPQFSPTTPTNLPVLINQQWRKGGKGKLSFLAWDRKEKIVRVDMCCMQTIKLATNAKINFWLFLPPAASLRRQPVTSIY